MLTHYSNTAVDNATDICKIHTFHDYNMNSLHLIVDLLKLCLVPFRVHQKGVKMSGVQNYQNPKMSVPNNLVAGLKRHLSGSLVVREAIRNKLNILVWLSPVISNSAAE